MTKSHQWGYDDYEYYIIDKNGHIGFMTTGGYGHGLLFEECIVAATKSIYNYVTNLTATSDAVVINKRGRINDWVDKSKLGLYGYDYNYETDMYIAVTKPTRPISINGKCITQLMNIANMDFSAKSAINGIDILDSISNNKFAAQQAEAPEPLTRPGDP